MGEEEIICKNCKTHYTGNYCNSCGQKKISDSDFSLRNIFSQAFEAITNLDSKFFKTFKLQFQNPGKLSKKYIEGIRAPYLKPFQIFLICNLLFFIFLSDTDFFRSPSKWIFNDNVMFYGMSVMTKVREIMEQKNISLDELKIDYDRVSTNTSKSLLILLIPFTASIGLLYNFKIKFGKHLIFATHLISQLLLSTTILFLLATNIPGSNRWFFMIPVIVVSIFYNVISIRRFYEKNILTATIYGIIGFGILIFFIELYRNFITILSLNLV